MKKEKYATEIQSKISAYCLKKGIPYNKTINMSKSFYPDCLIVINSITYWFEVKAGKDRLSKGQTKIIEDLNIEKEVAFVIESFKQFLDIIKTLPEPKKIIKESKKDLINEMLDL